MSAIVIKTEKNECEEIEPQIKEGGGVGSGTSGGGVGRANHSAGATVGPKAFAEKTQAALKVVNDAKQLNLRLKDPHQLMPRKLIAAPKFSQTGKRVSSITEEKLKEDTNDQTNTAFKVGSKRFRVQTQLRYAKQVKTPPPDMKQQPAMSSSKCGEIFVTNNARKWTFVCTYCQKTTRDIGEFVCHIKFRHISEQYHEDEDNDCEENVPDQQGEVNEVLQADCYDNLDQDVPSTVKPKTTKSINITSNEEYFDCANYLDVNVHTEADELPNNGVKIKSSMKTGRQSKTKENNNRQIQKNKFVVNLLDDDDLQSNDKNTNNNTESKNEIYEYDMEEDEDGVEIVDDENNEAEGVDDDNLLLLRSSSIDDTVGDGGGVGSKGGSKKYRSHVRGKAYCNLCDKTFQYYSLYRNHMIKHSNVTPYKCEYCSKAFKSKQAIRYHMNTHTKEVQYTCPLCPMTYGTENQFITHVLNHESDTCFPCMVCAKILKSDQEREEHLSTHTEERPFGCNYCNKRFRQKHHLSNHLKLHCQYRCDFCKEEFSSTQTQRRPYACASCEEYPEIRIQVEKQRSKSLNNSEVNPLELFCEGGGAQGAENTECVDLATDDDDNQSEASNSIRRRSNSQNRVTCKYCTRAYKNYNALNHHMRQKHSNVWRDIK